MSGLVIWFTGLSSAGKTTLGTGLMERLRAAGHAVELLDGDAFRSEYSSDLGFSKSDRDENVRRIGLRAAELAAQGTTVIVCAVSPYRAARDAVRRKISRFVEVYVNSPLAVCESRDAKGLYRRARAGQLPAFTGIDDPYEPPLDPDAECRTSIESVEECIEKVLDVVAHLR